MKRVISLLCAAVLLTGCAQGSQTESSEAQKMNYIKRVMLYDTLTAMYNDPEPYLGKDYHMVGLLYFSEGDDGEPFYSIYARDPDGGDHGIGLELDWKSFDGLKHLDKVTVEGRLEKTTVRNEDSDLEILILRVSDLKKRE